MKPLVALIAAGMLVAAPVHSQSQYPKTQIDRAERLNDRCRGGSGDDPATMQVCDQRDAAYSKLETAGWCYGKEGDAGYQRKWQRCIGAAKPVTRKPARLTGYVFSHAARAAEPGQAIKRADMLYVLYSRVPCPLPIAAAPNMEAAEMLLGQKLVPACWGRTLSPLGDEFVIVSQFGNSHSSTLMSFVEAKFSSDGTATIVGPAISEQERHRRLQDYQRSLRQP